MANFGGAIAAAAEAASHYVDPLAQLANAGLLDPKAPTAEEAERAGKLKSPRQVYFLTLEDSWALDKLIRKVVLEAEEERMVKVSWEWIAR